MENYLEYFVSVFLTTVTVGFFILLILNYFAGKGE
jgi:hypothetical protein|tara:strand:- start:469 stop:573 length:105 start_codon:yes stop_codon:yes gene_type:complete